MRSLLFAVVAAALGCGAAMADVIKGGFEAGTPSDGAGTHWTRLVPGDTSMAGWTVGSGNVDWFSAQAAQPCAGSRSLELNGNTNGSIRQAIATGTSTTLLFESRTTRDDGGLNAFGPVIDNVVVTADGATRTMTDPWWVEAESGSGSAILQQGRTLFIDMFVFGADTKPTWFVAAAALQPGGTSGHVVFSGDVYTGTGPYYGAPYDSAPVVPRKVGTLSFDADTISTARLTYSVDGTTVVKDVTRETWGRRDASGSYFGGGVADQTLCGGDNGRYEEQDYIEIVHNADNSFTMKWTDLQKRTVTFTGTYRQSGHMGHVTVTSGSDQSGTSFTGSFFELERTVAGITRRGHLVASAGGIPVCVIDVRWGGVRR